MIIKLLTMMSTEEINNKKENSAKYIKELKEGNSQTKQYSFITPMCDSFCYIGQGGVALENKTFSKQVLDDITEFSNAEELWGKLFDEKNNSRLTRKEKNKENSNSPKEKRLPQLCHRIMIFCYPTQFLDISRLEELKIIANWLNESLEDNEKINVKAPKWYELNLAIYKKIKEIIKEESLTDFDYRICQLGWRLVMSIKREKMKEELKNMVEFSRNLILTGAPGTGKTYLAHEIAAMMLGENSWENVENNSSLNERCKMVQFHPSYDYSDFVEGLRPVKSEDRKSIGFERKDGVFKEFCKNALKAYTDCTEDKKNAPKYVFIIDEINRGEMSKIFGELFFSIDPGYRGTKGKINSQYQNLVDKEKDGNCDLFKDGFFVPENVYIIGTMNDIDRSVESMDFAMRRRFAFKEVRATDRETMLDENLNAENAYEAKRRMYNLNYRIQEIDGLNEAYHVGPAYFTKLKEDGTFDKLWENRIKGLLYEYLRGIPNADDLLESLKRAYDEGKENAWVEAKDGVLKLTNASIWQTNVINKPKKSKNANIGDGEDDSSEG